MGESGDGGRVYAAVVGGFEDELEDAMRWWRTCQALRPATMIRVGVVQFSPRLGQLQDNVTAVRDFCARFAPGSLDLLCLPEMVLTGYGFPNAAAIAPHLEHPKNGPTARLCAELATNLRCYVAAGYPERLYDADQETGAIGANSGLLYDPRGNCITNYRKSNLYEMDKSWARAGTGFTTFNLPPPIGHLTLGICMDLNPFPPADWRGTEGPYELASHAWSNGTNVLVLLNSWLDSGHDPADAHDWHTLNYWAARLRPLWDIDTGNTGARKQTLVVICNRTGTENGKTFAGTSAVLRLVHGSGKPQLLHMMGRREEGVRLWNIATR